MYSYDDAVRTLEAELGGVEHVFRELTPEDWVTSTLLRPLDEKLRNWTVFELAGHLDISIGLTRMLIASAQEGQVGRDDDLLARRTVAGRPADLGDDIAWIRAASGRAEHPDPRLPLIG